MSRTVIYYTITVLFAGFALYTGKIIIDHGNGYKHEMNTVAKTLNFEERLLKPKEWLFAKHAWKELNEKYEKIAVRAKDEYEHITKWVIIFTCGCLIYLLTVLTMYVKTGVFFRKASLSLGFLSFMLLFVGLFCPMLEISALHNNLHVPIYIDIPVIGEFDLSRNFEGKMYYFYQNKSIADVIVLLFQNENYFVGTCILFFSIIFPVTKLLFTILSVYSSRWRHNKAISFIVQTLGKWSMADVMVAACFLAFLSFANMNAGVDNESDILHGMYFFLGFVILSLVSSVCLKIHDKRIKANQMWTLSH
ncbi:MAG: paraquat-inducible protein A [Flavobacteriales bacterium]